MKESEKQPFLDLSLYVPYISHSLKKHIEDGGWSELESSVLDSYLLWEFLKDTVRGEVKHFPVDRDRIDSSMALAKELITGFSHNQKLKMIQLFSPFTQRARLLEEKQWSLGEYPVSELGTIIPNVGDLPPEVIVRSFVEVTDYVRQNSQSNSISIKYIHSLSPLAEILEEIPIMVIEPGSEQRRPDEMVRVSGQQDWKIHETRGYIEDGNHRALALALADPNRTTIQAYVGRGRKL